MVDEVEFEIMNADGIRDTPVVIRYIQNKWRISHAKSYQNAFINSVNSFENRMGAVEFAEDCDGVMAGGMCDSMECACDDDYEDYEEPEEECYMTPDGYCMAAGSEYCDWDCQNNRGS